MTDPAHSDRRRENLIRAHQTGANAAEKRPGPQVAKSVTGPPSVPPGPHRETLIRTDIANAARRLTDRCQTELESLTDAPPPPGKPPGPSRNQAAMETLLLARPFTPAAGEPPGPSRRRAIMETPLSAELFASAAAGARSPATANPPARFASAATTPRWLTPMTDPVPPTALPDPHRENLIRADIADMARQMEAGELDEETARRLTDRYRAELDALTEPTQPPIEKRPGLSRNRAITGTWLPARPFTSAATRAEPAMGAGNRTRRRNTLHPNSHRPQPASPPDPHRATLTRINIPDVTCRPAAGKLDEKTARSLIYRYRKEPDTLTDTAPPPRKPAGLSRNRDNMETVLLTRPFISGTGTFPKVGTDNRSRNANTLHPDSHRPQPASPPGPHRATLIRADTADASRWPTAGEPRPKNRPPPKGTGHPDRRGAPADGETTRPLPPPGHRGNPAPGGAVRVRRGRGLAFRQRERRPPARLAPPATTVPEVNSHD